ncbi:hypothetical protein PR002_g22993 [Phytophthora rubi]|uniref:Uncharacterized protein n=2 Tax=Phytophthora rubi TaxID=129364 RepID=A0A6A3IQV1_9STRA|nr:hypothetical protein PR002_g22993 [Phytophthora rubi]
MLMCLQYNRELWDVNTVEQYCILGCPDSTFPSCAGSPFFCRVVDRDDGFEVELFDQATESGWSCLVTPDTLDLYTTIIPIDKVAAFFKIGLGGLGSGHASEEVVLVLIEQTEKFVNLQLRLRFGMEGCYWNPTLNFMLEPVNAKRREKLELRANIAAMALELSNKATSTDTTTIKSHPSPMRKGLSWLFSLAVIFLATSMAIVCDIPSVGDVSPPPARGIAFASVKPCVVDGGGTIYWEPGSDFDERVFSIKQSKLQVTERGFAQVSIMLRHSNCRSDIAFKVYQRAAEAVNVYDYTCGLFSKGISTAYIHTIPVEVNDTLRRWRRDALLGRQLHGRAAVATDHAVKKKIRAICSCRYGKS